MFLAFQLLISCNNDSNNQRNSASNQELNNLFDQYHTDFLNFSPISATYEGDSTHNAQLTIDFTDGFRSELKSFLTSYLDKLHQFDTNQLNENDFLSYQVFQDQLSTSLEELSFNSNLIPINQFWGLHQTMVQLGSGQGAQPFKTVKDYNDWVSRATIFSAWIDSAIVYFNKGIQSNITLPKILVEKLIPQLTDVSAVAYNKSEFYGPIKNFPKNFSESDKKELTLKYTNLIKNQLNPAYQKLANYLKNDYLKSARTSSGINALPNGESYYKFLVRQSTTTNKTPQEIYEIGLSEVARIRGLMEGLAPKFNYKGDLLGLFEYLNNKDPKNKPFKTPKQVIAAFKDIQKIIEPHLKDKFSIFPKTPFEIRRTEAFREKTASAEYNQGSPDGKRPGIFYVPILDAKNFTITSGMQSLFLHEAIPGHHFQISIQQEDTTLPKFRRFGGYNAFAEGWALYCESIGKELGCYEDPYQYMGALGDEMHRAIRLVVDVAIHTGKMNRDEALKYMIENEPISLEGATAEIERYMVIPGQALGYKIGALKIRELRNNYEKQLGTKFSIIGFHDNILKGGCLPLTILETKMDKWANAQAK